GHKVGIGVVLQVQVLRRNVQGVEVLALVLVHALDLAVKDGVGIDLLAGGLAQVVGKDGLVLSLDLAQTLQHGGVAGKLLQLLELGGVLLEAVADDIGEQVGQAGVGSQQPAAVSDAVGDVGEGLGLVQEIIVEDAVLDDL